jgi:redox-sensitive bicupin YhaK (pirin superfamily)
MQNMRTIRTIIKGRPTMEGAGVHLKRIFGNSEVPLFDPFLMLDDFRSNNPDHYRAGFPWHPHRGIETITYVLCGDVEHGDHILVTTGAEPVRFLLISGKPIGEPVAWHGPIVMNTDQAFEEYQNGTFIK